MGTDCHIVVVGPNAEMLSDMAICRVSELESLWSRFDSTSEIASINRNSGSAVRVSASTIELVEVATLAWQLSDGLFDPTMHEQINGLGYNSSFEHLDTSAAARRVKRAPAAGCGSIVTNRSDMTVRMPAGVAFDPGGIGKGFAADLVSKEVMESGASGVLVSLGGDMRVRGHAPSADGWVVRILEPAISPESLTAVALDDAALATSSTLRRRWKSGDQDRHHILNPKTGLPHDGNIILSTVVAGDAWWAEAGAKAALIGSELIHPSIPNAAIYRVLSNGHEERWGDFESYEI
jgi:thiamine biosynthesis lipoprotein